MSRNRQRVTAVERHAPDGAGSSQGDVSELIRRRTRMRDVRRYEASAGLDDQRCPEYVETGPVGQAVVAVPEFPSKPNLPPSLLQAEDVDLVLRHGVATPNEPGRGDVGVDVVGDRGEAAAPTQAPGVGGDAGLDQSHVVVPNARRCRPRTIRGRDHEPSPRSASSTRRRTASSCPATHLAWTRSRSVHAVTGPGRDLWRRDAAVRPGGHHPGAMTDDPLRSQPHSSRLRLGVAVKPAPVDSAEAQMLLCEFTAEVRRRWQGPLLVDGGAVTSSRRAETAARPRVGGAASRPDLDSRQMGRAWGRSSGLVDVPVRPRTARAASGRRAARPRTA